MYVYNLITCVCITEKILETFKIAKDWIANCWISEFLTVWVLSKISALNEQIGKVK